VKVKYANRSHWNRVKERSFSVYHENSDSFQGAVAVLNIHKVRTRLVIPYEAGNICIADDGYVWVQHFPRGLYLDVVALPNGDYYTLDQDELDAALKFGEITREQYDLALRTHSKVTGLLELGQFDILREAEKWVNRYKNESFIRMKVHSILSDITSSDLDYVIRIRYDDGI